MPKNIEALLRNCFKLGSGKPGLTNATVNPERVKQHLEKYADSLEKIQENIVFYKNYSRFLPTQIREDTKYINVSKNIKKTIIPFFWRINCSYLI